MSSNLEALGEVLREKRRERKLTQSDVARRLGMSRATISLLENGTVPELGIRKFLRIAELLGLELALRPEGAPPTLEELMQERK